MKKIIKTLIFNSLLLTLFFGVFNNVKAQETPVVHYIFDKQEVKNGENFTLTLLLEKYQDLSTVQFVCKVNEEVLTPVNINNQYFVKPTMSLFEESEIYENSYLPEQGILRFVAITKGGKTYGYSSLNQVFNITFQAQKDLNKVEEYFYESMDSNIGSSTILIDKWAKEIDSEVRYSEVLKTNWDKEKYQVDVFGIIPNITNDLEVLNRTSSEYKLEIISDELDLTKVGSQVIKVKIYDYVNTQVLYFAKTIEVVDKIAPVIEVTNQEVWIEDSNINDEHFNYFKISDNYDQKPTLNYQYYSEKNQEIISLSEFKKYLKNNLIGKISCYAVDSSGNKSAEVEIVVKIKDTTPPVINILEDIVVEDTNLGLFNLESLITISDGYDKNPVLKLKIITNDGIDYTDYLEALEKVYDIVIEYYVVDASENESEHYQVKVTLKDTTPPSLKNVLDVVIPDEKLNYYLSDHHLLEKDFIMIDNFTKELFLNTIYYNDDIIVTESEFFDNLKKGLSGKIAYQVVDSYGNMSEVLYQKVSVLDDTAPIINIKNIEDNKKYLGPITIDYEVVDNIEGFVDVKISLNGEKYQNIEIIDLGAYTFVVEATDLFGNKSVKEISFEIVEENFFGCIDGFDCEENNYAVGIIIGIGIVLIVGIVVTIEIIYMKKKKSDAEPQE